MHATGTVNSISLQSAAHAQHAECSHGKEVSQVSHRYSRQETKPGTTRTCLARDSSYACLPLMMPTGQFWLIHNHTIIIEHNDIMYVYVYQPIM